MYGVYKEFWQVIHQIYGHIRCIYTILVNPTYNPSHKFSTHRGTTEISGYISFFNSLQLLTNFSIGLTLSLSLCLRTLSLCLCLSHRRQTTKIGLARTVSLHHMWPYIWWFPCQKLRIYTVHLYYSFLFFWPTQHKKDTTHVMQDTKQRPCLVFHADSAYTACTLFLSSSTKVYLPGGVKDHIWDIDWYINESILRGWGGGPGGVGGLGGGPSEIYWATFTKY